MQGKDATEAALGICGEPTYVATTRFCCLLASAGSMSKVLKRNPGIAFALDETFAAKSRNKWPFASADFPSQLPSKLPVQLFLTTFRFSCG